MESADHRRERPAMARGDPQVLPGSSESSPGAFHLPDVMTDEETREPERAQLPNLADSLYRHLGGVDAR